VAPSRKTLASGVSRTVGILVADILNPYLAVLAKTIDEAARSKGFDIAFSRLTARRTKPPKEQIGNLIAQRVGGLILIGAPDDIKIVE
jgi:DNA-binding LacI/PurR family transcriptional regulator